MSKIQLGFIGVIVMLVGCTSAPAPEAWECTSPDDLNAEADVTLTAGDVVLEPVPGSPMVAWSYNGDVPGPVLRVPLGETRRVKLVNSSPRPASLHFHGVQYTAADDGTLMSPESMVYPGCAHVYTITADQPGVWPFHSHYESRTEISRGLYGAVIVPAADEVPADHEFVVFMGQLGLEDEEAEGGEEEEEEEEEGGMEMAGFFMTLNGRANGNAEVIELEGDHYVATSGAVATARVGDLVRWRVLNVSPDDAHTFHIHGHTWCDRGGLPDEEGVCPNGGIPTDNVGIEPVESLSLEFIEDSPGTWMFHCHIVDHVNDGMMAYYQVDPASP